MKRGQGWREENRWREGGYRLKEGRGKKDIGR